MADILGDSDETLLQKLNEEVGNPDVEDAGLSLLSSGQAILAHFVTALMAWIEPNSLILFDEPETHLHPNAVATLFNVFVKILRDNESFAVIATHSPIVCRKFHRSAFSYSAERVMSRQRRLWDWRASEKVLVS